MAYNEKIRNSDITCTMAFTCFVKLFTASIPSFDKITFDPNISNTNNTRVWNIYQGFKAKEVTEVDMTLIQPILTHIKDVWAGGDEHHYRYLICWLADRIKHPGIRPGVALFLYSKEKGVGKNAIIDFLIEYVFGDELSIAIAGIDNLVNKFNSVTCCKLLVNANEASQLDGNYHSSWDRLKVLITDPKQVQEKKGIDAGMIRNFMALILCSNHLFSLKIEPGCRRFACFECSSKYLNDREYFNQLHKLLNQQRTGDHFFTYLLRYPQQHMVDLRTFPHTELRRSLIERNLSTPARFVQQLKDQGIQSLVYDENEFRQQRKLDPLRIDYTDGWIKGSYLYLLFDSWCTTRNERKMSSTAFGGEIKAYLATKKSICQLYNINQEAIIGAFEKGN
jgi:hypothetical protein